MSKSVNKLLIDDFMSDKYVEYSKYVLEFRAIPSIVDGLKTSQRKALMTSYNIWKNDTGSMKYIKVFQLGGKVADECYYHHGNVSLEDAIVGMSQTFKNNLPYLTSESQNGSRFVPESGASRYVSVKLNPFIKNVLLDYDLLEFKYEEGFKIEPKFFLPIIPMILINGSSGVAVAHASDILNRNAKEVVTECLNYLNGKKIRNIKPSYTFFNGEFIQDKENKKKWYSVGKFSKINASTIQITEVPLGYTFETYDSVLEKLLSDGKILSYEDNSKNDINYVVKVNRSWLSGASDSDIIKLFKLEKPYTENYTLLDENGKIKIFDNVEQILKHFVDFRLSYYNIRIKYNIDKLNKSNIVLKNKMLYVKLIVDKKLLINNRKKDDVIKDLIKFKLDKIDGSYDYLLNMSIVSLTKDMIDKLSAKIKENDNELAVLKKTKAKDLYIEELEKIKKIL